MSSSESDSEAKNLTPEEKRDRRKQQLREAQRRFYATHKKKKDDDVIPVSYSPEYIQTYHKNYYQRHKDKLNERSKQRYARMRQDTPPVETA
jgi:hypothetical protein